MSEQLTIRELAPYLPYGLKVNYYHHDSSIPPVVGELAPHNIIACIEYPKLYKPLLRPLSQLTETIEHNGDEFIPIKELLMIKYPYEGNPQSQYGEITIDKSGYPSACYSYMATKEIMLNTTDIEEWPKWVINKLAEWHFDFQNLIPRNLALPL